MSPGGATTGRAIHPPPRSIGRRHGGQPEPHHATSLALVHGGQDRSPDVDERVAICGIARGLSTQKGYVATQAPAGAWGSPPPAPAPLPAPAADASVRRDPTP